MFDVEIPATKAVAIRCFATTQQDPRVFADLGRFWETPSQLREAASIGSRSDAGKTRMSLPSVRYCLQAWPRQREATAMGAGGSLRQVRLGNVEAAHKNKIIAMGRTTSSLNSEIMARLQP
jgi:hypothetical protein